MEGKLWDCIYILKIKIDCGAIERCIKRKLTNKFRLHLTISSVKGDPAAGLVLLLVMKASYHSLKFIRKIIMKLLTRHKQATMETVQKPSAGQITQQILLRILSGTSKYTTGAQEHMW